MTTDELNYRSSLEEQFAGFDSTNPTVRAAMSMHRQGDIDLITALKVAVVSLATQNRSLQEHLTEGLMWSCRPFKVGG